jgi:hypothetical protein
VVFILSGGSSKELKDCVERYSASLLDCMEVKQQRILRQIQAICHGCQTSECNVDFDRMSRLSFEEIDDRSDGVNLKRLSWIKLKVDKWVLSNRLEL